MRFHPAIAFCFFLAISYVFVAWMSSLPKELALFTVPIKSLIFYRQKAYKVEYTSQLEARET